MVGIKLLKSLLALGLQPRPAYYYFYKKNQYFKLNLMTLSQTKA
jgi:hypothetical protein